MKTKSTLFVSAALTAFVLVMLAGVVMAFRSSAKADVLAAQPTPTIQADTPTPAPTQPAVLLPQEAAAIAANYLGRQDLYSVESATINGVDAFKVTFSSGDVAYVGLDGQVISVVPVQPVVIPNTVPAAPKHAGNGNRNSGGEEHEGNEGGGD